MSAKELLKMIDEGVPLEVAAEASGVALGNISGTILEELKRRQAAARAKLMAKLFGATQRASANPSAIAAAAQAWIKLSDNGKESGQEVSIEIVGENEKKD
jgi:hypothetical protein